MLDPQGLYAYEPGGAEAVDEAFGETGPVLLYHFDGYIDAGETGYADRRGAAGPAGSTSWWRRSTRTVWWTTGHGAR